LAETDAEYSYVLYHTDVRWLNHETVMETFLRFEAGHKCFKHEKGKAVSELNDEKWL